MLLNLRVGNSSVVNVMGSCCRRNVWPPGWLLFTGGQRFRWSGETLIHLTADFIQLLFANFPVSVRVFEKDSLCVVDFSVCLTGLTDGKEFLCVAQAGCDGDDN